MGTLSQNQSAAGLLCSLADAHKLRLQVPGVLHFVWIGDWSKADLSYLPVWRKFNPGLTLQLWTDSVGGSSAHMQQCLQRYAASNPEQSLFNLQNAAFDFIYSRIMRGESFNSSVAAFLNTHGIIFDERLIADNGCCIPDLPDQTVVRDINSLFESDLLPYRKHYFYELILRGNFAAASDIIRLLILYREGGTYIDLDTLPDLTSLFSATIEAESKFSLNHDEQICLAKTSAFLEWYKNGKILSFDYEIFINNITELSHNDRLILSESIKRDVETLRNKRLLPLGEISVHPDLMLMGAVSFLPGIFYNNMMSSAPGSRLIKLIIKYIARNYRYLERSGALYSPHINAGRNEFEALLVHYRHTFGTLSDPVTLRLTGPGAIIGTLISLIYRLIPETQHIPAEELGVLLQDDTVGLTIKKQTMDTPMGLK